MNGRSAELLKTLAIVQAAGSLLEPVWDPYGRFGVAYRGTDSELDDSRLQNHLEALAQEDYLERVFVERISLCPNCGNHAINVHEACLTCGSSNLTQFKAYFHFRCGYVGPVTAFAKEKQGLRCPKCSRILADLGTDHDSPGTYFRCRGCMAMFQVPEVGGRCLACGVRLSGSTLQEIGHHDVFAYRLTTLGRAAIAEGRLQLESVAGGEDVLLEKRDEIVAYVEEQVQKRAERGTKFGGIVIGAASDGASPVVENFASVIREHISVEFRLGRLDADHLLLIIPSGSKSVTKAVRGKIVALQAQSETHAFRVEIIEFEDIRNGDAVADALSNIARVMAIHV